MNGVLTAVEVADLRGHIISQLLPVLDRDPTRADPPDDTILSVLDALIDRPNGSQESPPLLDRME